MRVLSGELADVDALLDDERFFGPFRACFDPTEGRPSSPIDTYLRLMFLKCRCDLGYERLCRLVGDSITWRWFCRIGLEASVPGVKPNFSMSPRAARSPAAVGPDLIDGLNIELLAAAHEDGLVDLARVRADTTVVEADTKDPTDSGLLTAATGRIATCLRRLAKVEVRVAYTHRTLEHASFSIRSGCGCGVAATKPKPRSWSSPASWPIWPRHRWRRPPRRWRTGLAGDGCGACSTISRC